MTDTNSRLASALAAFQAELPRVGKKNTANTGTYSYDYADLEDVSREAMPVLGKHGLAFLAKPTLNEEGRFVLAYSLMHSSGEREDGIYPLPANGSPQQIGSAITYGRRYTFCAVTGLAPGGEDDDAAAASSDGESEPQQARNGRRPQAQQQRQPRPPSPRPPAPPENSGGADPITDPQKKKLGAVFGQLGFTNAEREQRLKTASQIVGRELETSSDLTKAEASKLIDTLERCGGSRENLIALLATGDAPDGGA